MSHDRDLKARAGKLPKSPGIYLFKDDRGRVLYVGKARSLRDRVAHYFGTLADPKISRMMEQAVDVEFLETESEVDALLLESRLVKDIKPKYNTELKDGKSYPYLEITWSDDFPKVAITREEPARGSLRFGPFTDVKELRQAVQILQGVFRFRTCDLEIRADDPKRRFQRPCLLYYIDRCTAPCADRVEPGVYREDLHAFRLFVEGKRKVLLDDLQRRMAAAASRLEYEEAAALRDQLKALQGLEKQGVFGERPDAMPLPVRPADALEDLQKALGLAEPPRVIEGVDIAHVAGEDTVGALVMFVDGIPFKDGYRRFRIKGVPGIDDFACIEEVVRRRYRRVADQEIPAADVLLIDGGLGQLGAARLGLKEAGSQPRMTVSLAKQDEVIYREGKAEPLRLPRASLALRLLQHVRDEAHRFAQGYHHLLRSKRIRGKPRKRR